MSDMNFSGAKECRKWNDVLKCISGTKLLQLDNYFSNMIFSDIKHLAFTLSRYKFASKLLMYRKKVNLLELGCQEALGALMFQQNTDLSTYTGVDFDERAIAWNREHLPNDLNFICADFFDYKELGNRQFSAVVSLDVIEHIPQEMEDRYCEIVRGSLEKDGVAIIGTPNIMMSSYACDASKVGHVNLYDQKRLYGLMNQYFHNVFIFNMNDEVINTGFAPMACYIFAVCCNPKEA